MKQKIGINKKLLLDALNFYQQHWEMEARLHHEQGRASRWLEAREMISRIQKVKREVSK